MLKKLQDYKDEIHRCSKCGICQHSCPVYQETGNDCTVSRGLFIMLDGVIKGDLKLNRNINKYLDLCLKCNKCKSACPTGIDALQIILSAKHEYFKTSIRGKLYSFLESKFVFNNILYFIGLITKLFSSKRQHTQVKHLKSKAIYFGGCIEKFQPDIRNYVVELLAKMDIEVINVNFDCCGMPFLTTGNLERFKEQSQENLEKLKNLKYDYFITDCASCQYIWEDILNVKVTNLYDLISENDIEFLSKEFHTLTYHKPCHEKSFKSIQKILNKCQNIEYKELKGYDECCGFGGFEHPWTLKTAYKIIKKKGQNILETKSDYLITSCIGCAISTSIATLFKTKSKRLISFLKEKCEIK